MKTLCTAVLALLIAVPAAAAPFNVALGKPVTITGEVGVITCCWPAGPVASLDTIVDGLLLPEETQWQTGTVWWDEFHPPSANNVVEVDLLGEFIITDLLLQADNNESYGIHYRDEFGGWNALPIFGPSGNFGMITRSAPVAPFVATAFRIDAFGGDAFYSVSEFQATGTPVPEPGTLLLFGAGAGAAALRRRYARANS
jgi:hypothetical protein